MNEMVKHWIEYLATGLEAIGVLVILIGSVLALIRYIPRLRDTNSYKALREELGRVILLGLEVLVAADIIGTVTADATLQSVVILGMIVLVRTFLSLSIQVEIEGKVPWKKQ